MKQEKWFIRRLFVKFFVPALLSSLGLAIGGLADCIYIGNKIGEDGLYILGIMSPVYMAFMTFAIAMAVGGTIKFSNLLGSGNYDEGRKNCMNTLVFNFIGVSILSLIGFVFAEQLIVMLGVQSDSAVYGMTLTYTRYMFVFCPILFMQAPLEYYVHSDGNPKLASLAMMVGCLVDCGTGFLLIVVGNAGVNGSIFSTVFGALAMEAICLVHFLTKKGSVRIEKVKLSLRDACGAFRLGFATSAQYIYKFVILFVFNRFLLEIYGASGVAIYDVVVNVVALVSAFIEATILAFTPLCATFTGEGNGRSVRACLGTSILSGVVATALATLALGIFAEPFCLFVGLDESIAGDGAYALRLVSISYIFACINCIVATYCQTAEKEGFSFIITIMREFIILLGFGTAAFFFNKDAFWYVYLAAEVLSLAGILIFAFIHKVVLHKSIVDYSGKIVFSESFNGSCEQISDTCERMQEFMEERGISTKQAIMITLSVDETCRIIATQSGNLKLQITLVLEDSICIVHLRDNASKFNPMEIDENSDEGLGLKIVRKKAKEYYYRQFVGFNILTLMFERQV
jgi:Na+-driven multidrug efflux pump